MVQEFQVVRCFSCQSFQVQQVKKVNRWHCKLCGHKQSLLKEFGRGSGADCRRHVQKLNAMRGAMMEEQERSTWSLWEEEQEHAEVRPPQVSRWRKYLDTPEEAEPVETDVMDRQQLHGNKQTDRKKRRSEEQRDGEEACSPGQSHRLMMKRHRPSARTSNSGTVASGESQVQEGEEPFGCGQGRLTGKACPDITARPRPLLPVASMFESGEDFDLDDDFLTNQRL